MVGVQTELQLLKDDGGGHCFKSATATVDANYVANVQMCIALCVDVALCVTVHCTVCNCCTADANQSLVSILSQLCTLYTVWYTYIVYTVHIVRF